MRSSATRLDALLLGEADAGRRRAAPSASNAADTGGPVTSSSRSVCRSAIFADPRRQPPRRAVGLDRLVDRQPRVLEPRLERRAELRGQARQPAGRESLRCRSRCSSSRSMRQALGLRCRLAARGVACADVRLADRDGQLPHAQDVGGALGHADAAARVEHVEQVRALQAVLERRQQQPALQQLLAERVVLVEQVAMERRELARGRCRCPGRRRTSTARPPRAAAPRRTSRRRPTRGRTRCRPSAGTSRCARGRR